MTAVRAARAGTAPLTFAGLPAARWLFGLRIWAGMVLALYVAFWLQLDGASSAMTCVAVLAQPTRGQVFEKALARLAATAVGVAASIAIAGLFAQERDLFVAAVSAWIGLCVFACNTLDGNRAYAAVLSGYTVSIVAVMQIDSPQDVFSSGIDRGAAIVVGIAATALVNDLFAAPDTLPKVLSDLSAMRRRTLDFARAALRDGADGAGGSDAAAAGPEAAAAVFRAAVALHPTISSLTAESALGRDRAAAARSLVAALVEEVMAARAVASRRASRRTFRAGPALTGLAGELDDADASRAARDRLERDAAAAAEAAPGAGGLPLLEAAALAERDRRAAEALSALRADRALGHGTRHGTGDAPVPRLPLFRSRRIAARKGVRVGLAVALSAALFVHSSWPQTSIAFALLGVVASLAANTPSPTGFAIGALVGVPAAAALVGVLEFVVLDGVDAYPLLCIALAPPVIGACLMLTSPNPKLGGIGFLLLVFTSVILGPSNPQSYDPLSYLVLSLLAVTAVLLLALWLTVLPPSTPAQQRRWILRSAATDLRRAVRDGRVRRDPAEDAYRSADRIGQIAALGSAGDPGRDAALADAFLLADLDGAVRRARHRLAALGRAPGGAAAAAAGGAALSALDPAALRRAAVRCRSVAAGLAVARDALPDGQRRAGAALQLAAELAEAHRADLARLVPGLVPGPMPAPTSGPTPGVHVA